MNDFSLGRFLNQIVCGMEYIEFSVIKNPHMASVLHGNNLKFEEDGNNKFCVAYVARNVF